MDKPKATPKDFFLWAGAMVALYWSVVAFLFLMFDYLNYALPGALDYASDPYQSGIPYETASLLVLFPLFLVLMYCIRREIARDASRSEVWVRRWALYLTLFVAGVAIAADLVTLLSTFFSGSELTPRFLFKVLLVLLVAAAGFMHFIADLRGYWFEFPERTRRVGWATGALALLTILAGFVIVGTPWQAQNYRLDAQKVQDLQTIQYQVVTYWQHAQKLPATLADLNDSLSNVPLPSDPQSGHTYTYQSTGTLSFKLCADFSAPSQAGYSAVSYAIPEPAGLGGPGMSENWQHGSGNVCFDRTISPTLHPPIK